ncbi:CIA30 family protein [Salinimicrobium sediminis]|nr:CIA30 family protein [Salinimicrobium sediminis]
MEIPLDQMKPVYRGRDLDMPTFSANAIQEIRFLIDSKKQRDFEL